MTNGEIITAMFPDMIESAWVHKKYLTNVCGDYSAIEYTDEWWNAEYKGSFAVLEREKGILEKIRADIINKHFSIKEDNDFDSGRTYGYEECLTIIGKHIGRINETDN